MSMMPFHVGACSSDIDTLASAERAAVPVRGGLRESSRGKSPAGPTRRMPRFTPHERLGQGSPSTMHVFRNVTCLATLAVALIATAPSRADQVYLSLGDSLAFGYDPSNAATL